jgi:hypothetical protein
MYGHFPLFWVSLDDFHSLILNDPHQCKSWSIYSDTSISAQLAMFECIVCVEFISLVSCVMFCFCTLFSFYLRNHCFVLFGWFISFSLIVFFVYYFIFLFCSFLIHYSLTLLFFFRSDCCYFPLSFLLSPLLLFSPPGRQSSVCVLLTQRTPTTDFIYTASLCFSLLGFWFWFWFMVLSGAIISVVLLLRIIIWGGDVFTL